MLDKMCIKVPNIKQMKTGYCAKGLVSVQEHMGDEGSGSGAGEGVCMRGGVGGGGVSVFGKCFSLRCIADLHFLQI